MPDVLRVVLAEAQRLVWVKWTYKMSLVIQGTVLLVMFLFNSLFIRQATGTVAAGEPGSPMFTLVGYLVWFYAMQAVEGMSTNLATEAQTGTLEQKYLSPTPALGVLGGNIVGNLLVNTGIVTVVGVVLMLTFRITYHMSVWVLPILGLTLVGIYGFGFLLAGLTLIFKQIGPMATLLQYAFMFLNGSLLPVDRLPVAVQYIAFSLPSTHGIILLRRIMIDGESGGTFLVDGSLAVLLFHSLLYLTSGIGLYLLCQRQARVRGMLGQY